MMNDNLLAKKLTNEEQHGILNALFGFDLINTNDDHWVLYDEEGYEFYGNNNNLQFEFSTLNGIFSFAIFKAKQQGYSDCQFAFRKLLDIN